MANVGQEFIVAGDSHIFAMGAAQNYSGPVSLSPIEGTNGRGYFLMEEWVGGRGASYWDGLVALAAGRTIVLVLMGNQHFGSFLLAREPLFDFVDPSDPSHPIIPNATVVPRRLVKSLPEFSTDGLRELIGRLRAQGCHHVAICGTPPVRDDFGDAAPMVRESEFFRGRAKGMGLDINNCRFTPPAIMRRLWGVIQEALTEVAEETASQFVPVPADAFDEHGYLAPLYRGPLVNFTHPNEMFGRLILKRIIHDVTPPIPDERISHGSSLQERA